MFKHIEHTKTVLELIEPISTMLLLIKTRKHCVVEQRGVQCDDALEILAKLPQEVASSTPPASPV